MSSTPLQRVRGGGVAGRGRPFPFLQQQAFNIGRSYVGSAAARGGQRGSFVVRKRAHPATQTRYSTMPTQNEEDAKRPRFSEESVSQPNSEKHSDVHEHSPLVEDDDEEMTIHEEVVVEEENAEEWEDTIDVKPPRERSVRTEPIRRPREPPREPTRAPPPTRNGYHNKYDRPRYPEYDDYRHERYPPEPRRQPFQRPVGRYPAGRDPYGHDPYRDMRMRRESQDYTYNYGPSTSRYDQYLDSYRYGPPPPPLRYTREDPYRRDYPPPPEYPEDLETALENAWNSGFIDILEMGRAVYTAKLAGTFSERSIQRFIDSRVQRTNFICVHSDSYSSLSMEQGIADNFGAYMEGNTLMNSIFIRWHTKIEPVVQFADDRPPTVPTHTPITTLAINPRFLTKIYRIRGDEVFRDVNLTNLVAKWPVPGQTTQMALTSLFRKVLQHLCKFPPNIKKYTIRISTRGGNQSNLLELPQHVKTALEELGMGLLNMDREELSDDPPPGYRNSLFYMELADTEDGRESALEQLKSQRREWLALVPVLLRNAVRDVRMHTVTQKVENGKEIYTWRHTKRKKEPREENGELAKGGDGSSQ